jgi:hypothetical protein
MNLDGGRPDSRGLAKIKGNLIADPPRNFRLRSERDSPAWENDVPIKKSPASLAAREKGAMGSRTKDVPEE